MRMRSHHFLKIQWLMVWVIFTAILTWGVPSLVSEIQRRWTTCEYRAVEHARDAAAYSAMMKANTKKGRFDARVVVQAAYHARKSKEYQRALYIPWKWYVMGDK